MTAPPPVIAPAAFAPAASLDPADAEPLLRHQTAVMELIADGAPLPQVLDAVALALEDLMPGSRCSILLQEPDGSRLRHGAAPTLPAVYSRAIDGIEIGPTAGSCGTAAHYGSEVIAEDVLTDPRWVAFRDLAVPHGLRACWSSPIRGGSGPVGTFAVYHGQPHQPNARERGLVARFTHLASVAVDHHRLYGALAESEERFRRVFEDNAVGMVLTRLDGCVVRANQAFLDLVGHAETAVVGQDLAGLVTMTGAPPWRSASSAERAEHAGAAPYEATAPGPGGRLLRLSVSVSTIRDAVGRPARLSLTVVDITQRWEAARERRAREAAEFARRSAEQARLSAEAANRAKSAFVSALSHELRTPLQAITGFTELLQGLDLSPDRRRAALEHIGGATQHILSLVDDVLDLARVEAGALPLHVVDVPVADVVGEVLSLLAPLARARDVRLTSEPTGAVVRADPRRLLQVLLNVVGNGIRYNTPAGQVTVAVSAEPPGRVRLEVTDTGPGISADLRERLFVPFDRLDADAGPERGVGLGLVLSRSLTEAMAGTLDVTSEVGRGTAVRVILRASTSADDGPGDRRRCRPMSGAERG